MKISGATVLGLALLLSSGAFGQGNPCEEYVGTGGGCSLPAAVTHSGYVDGGIDFTGTSYDGTCAFGCASIYQPMLRFWEYGRFDERNSGDAEQATPGLWWMVNPALDFGLPVPTGLWALHQASWSRRGVEGCINTPGDRGTRTVAEVSFCDVTDATYYVVASVEDPAGTLFDFDDITGAGTGPGGRSNLLPLTAVPTVPETGELEWYSAGPGHATYDIDLTGVTLPSWSELGQDVLPLVRGVEILYHTDMVEPVDGCRADLSEWLPVLDPADTSSLMGPLPAGGVGTVAVPEPPDPDRYSTWFMARVVYVDEASGCGPADPCLDPGLQRTPVSCPGPATWVLWQFVEDWPGACCLPEGCEWLPSRTCGYRGGAFQGFDTSCFPDPCAPPRQALYADYSGDGLADPFVWRPTNGRWYWLTSESGFTDRATEQLGLAVAGDVPLVCDMDGDGTADPLVWRSTTGRWYWKESSRDGALAVGPTWGLCWDGPSPPAFHDTPLAADMDGDGLCDPVVWRTTAGARATGTGSSRAGA